MKCIFANSMTHVLPHALNKYFPWLFWTDTCYIDTKYWKRPPQHVCSSDESCMLCSEWRSRDNRDICRVCDHCGASYVFSKHCGLMRNIGIDHRRKVCHRCVSYYAASELTWRQQSSHRQCRENFFYFDAPPLHETWAVWSPRNWPCTLCK